MVRRVLPPVLHVRLIAANGHNYIIKRIDCFFFGRPVQTVQLGCIHRMDGGVDFLKRLQTPDLFFQSCDKEARRMQYKNAFQQLVHVANVKHKGFHKFPVANFTFSLSPLHLFH